MAERQATGTKEAPRAQASQSSGLAPTNGNIVDKLPKAVVRDRSADYLKKGPIQIARTIVRNRGIMGLYTGFRLHQRKWPNINNRHQY